MPTIAERDERRNTVQKVIDDVLKFDMVALDNPELGAMKFSMLRDQLSYIFRILPLAKIRLSLLPWPRLNNLHGQLNSLKAYLARIQQFKIVPDAAAPPNVNIAQQYQALIDEFDGLYMNCLESVGVLVLQEQIDGEERKALISTSLSAVETVKSQQANVTDLTQRSEQILAKLQTQAVSSGSHKYAETFDTLASEFRKAALTWLLLTLAGGVSVVGLGVYALLHDLPEFSGAFVGRVAGRLVILTVVFYFVGLAARNFRASKHNEIVNRHRAVALKTFELFTAGAADEQTKSAVLIKTTEAIFQSLGTGYQSGDAEPAPNSTIVEILRREKS